MRMADCHPDNIRGDSSFSNDTDFGTSVTSEGVSKDNSKAALVENYSSVIVVEVKSNHEGNDDESDDDGDEIYSPFPEDVILPDITEEVVDKTMKSSLEQVPKVLEQTESHEHFSPVNGTLFALVHQEKMNAIEETNKFIPFARESFLGMNDRGHEEFKEVSVQTAENQPFISNDTCPICKLESEDLKTILTAFCLEYSYNKRKFEAMEKDILNVAVEEVEDGFHEGHMKKKVLPSDDQIVPRSSSLIQNNEGGKRGFRDSSSRTIRLGLSRRVKLQPLHQYPKSQEASRTSHEKPHIQF